MLTKRVRVNLSLPPYLIKKLREVGKRNDLQSTDGSLQNTSICTDLIEFICKLQFDEDIQEYLDENNETLLALIRRLLKNHASS